MEPYQGWYENYERMVIKAFSMAKYPKRLGKPWREATDEELRAVGLTRDAVRLKYLETRTPEQIAKDVQELFDELYKKERQLRKDADDKYLSVNRRLKDRDAQVAILSSIVGAAAFKGFCVFFVWLASLR